jgi:iron complex transport system substrate-binding protein
MGRPSRSALALILALALALTGVSACSGPAIPTPPVGLGNGWRPDHSLALTYAQNFEVDYDDGGLALITLSDGSRFLVVPEGQAVPTGIGRDMTVLQQPLGDVYVAATATMSLFVALNGLGAIRFSGAQADAWYIPQAQAAMRSGAIVYAGKYSAPDYELILSGGCQLAIESTMINHTPEVKVKLESLGIPVLVDQSSHEPHPLGRTEWIKLYGVLLGQQALAERLFAAQAAYLDEFSGQPGTGHSVAFFSISSAGYVVARKSGDYVAKMIELAGGDYVFRELGDPAEATSTINLEMERFYATAKDADYIVYNATIGGELRSLGDFLALNPLLGDFRAVREGHVWSTNQDFYQDMTGLGLMIFDLHEMLTSDASTPDQLNFLHRLS